MAVQVPASPLPVPMGNGSLNRNIILDIQRLEIFISFFFRNIGFFL